MKVENMVERMAVENRPKMELILRTADAYCVPHEDVEHLWEMSETADEMMLNLVQGLRISGLDTKIATTIHPKTKETVFFFGGEEVASLGQWTHAGVPTGKYRLVMYGFHDEETGLARKTKTITLDTAVARLAAQDEIVRHRGLIMDEYGYSKAPVEQPLIHEFEEM